VITVGRALVGSAARDNPDGSAAPRPQCMVRKWGSCSVAGTISLAADLDDQDPRFQDFVIVHELLHLKVPNHGRVFRALMSLHIPDWREHDVARRQGHHISVKNRPEASRL
jgi:predicted metal-dependent hydrolase